MPDVREITDQDALHEVVEALEGRPRFALDTESNSLHAYREQVCWIQLACEGRVFLLDTLRVPDLEKLEPFIIDPGVTKVLHGADYDMACLHRDFGWHFQGLFDTHVAAHLLGDEKLGLASLVEKWFGVELDKSLTCQDWAMRPLPEKLYRYLVEDVLYLERLHDELRALLEERDLLEEAEIEFTRVRDHRWDRPEDPDPEGFRRIKGAGALDHVGLGILRELYFWREEVARGRDVPPFKVLGNRQLLAIARNRPRSPEALVRARLVRPRVARQHGPDLIDAVVMGMRNYAEIPRRAPSREARLPNDAQNAAEALRTWRRDRVKKEGRPSLAILPNHVIDAIVRARPHSEAELAAIPTLGEKRLELYGGRILALLRKHLH